MKKLATWAVGVLAAVMVGVCLHSQALADGTRGVNWSTPTGAPWGTPGTCGSAYQILQPSDSNCNVALSNFQNFNPVASVITSSTPILPLSSYMILQTTGSGPTAVWATPNVSTSTTLFGTTPWPDGMMIVLTSTITGSPSAGAAVTLNDANNLTNSKINLDAGQQTHVVLSSSPVTLIYNAATTSWAEIGK